METNKLPDNQVSHTSESGSMWPEFGPPLLGICGIILLCLCVEYCGKKAMEYIPMPGFPYKVDIDKILQSLDDDARHIAGL